MKGICRHPALWRGRMSPDYGVLSASLFPVSTTMAIATNLDFAKMDDLCLDPMNPRLGRNNTGRERLTGKSTRFDEGLDSRRVGGFIS